MFVELHLLQNFPPHCLNRDDTNAPKDCEFGGHRRARISSQCIKRSIRQNFDTTGRLADHRGTRSRILVDEMLVPRLVEQGKDEQTARSTAEAALAAMGFGSTEGHSEYLLFLGRKEIENLTSEIMDHWDELAKAGGEKSGKKASKVPDPVKKSLRAVLNGGKAADVALFGRMLADLPEKNIDAACQVAHAISTNRISMEVDFYTAVDDLQPEADTGAGMMGTVEFNSACFYRYANIDVSQLTENLQGDGQLTRATIEAFVRAAIEAIPTGKQNSMAAQNPPSAALVVVRDHGLWSLANAFADPVRPDGSTGLVAKSVQVLDRHWGRMAKMYGADGIRAKALCLLDEVQLDALDGDRVDSVDDLVDAIMNAVPEAEEMPA